MRRRGLLAGAASVVVSLAWPRAAGAQPVGPLAIPARMLAVDSLLAIPGPRWRESRSAYFRLYTEVGSLGDRRRAALLDSLEEARAHALRLLGLGPHGWEARTTVLVTGARDRFAGLLAERGKAIALAGNEHVGRPNNIVMVHNDSVRAYTRHEVMHLLSMRTWGPAAAPGRWIGEGLAVFADGRCLGADVHAVARDVLRSAPRLTADSVARGFEDLERVDRARGYVLAGSLVGFLWATYGRDAVREIWRAGPGEMTRVSGLDDATLTRRWWNYTLGAAVGKTAPDSAAVRRWGCG